MKQRFDDLPIQWVSGNSINVDNMINVISAYKPFDSEVVSFLNALSKFLLKSKESKQYPDVVTFAFWIRSASILKYQSKYHSVIDNKLGRGIVFHISPSNVPVNFAYSLVASLLAGNANIVKVPSKKFEQVELILTAIDTVLNEYINLRNYIVCVRYDRQKIINDVFSEIANSRIIWGGDETIKSVRLSPLPVRANELTFSDRYSISVIQADDYLDHFDKRLVASHFYNDTYLSDQNACTAPVLICWLGDRKEEAKKIFWNHLHEKVLQEYSLKAVQSVSKYTKCLEWSSCNENLSIIKTIDNFITRVLMRKPSLEVVKNKGNSGLFVEYDADLMNDIFLFIDDVACQTISYVGEINDDLRELIFSQRPKGVDRIVKVGETMSFDLVWDGIDFIDCLTRSVTTK